MNTHVEVIVTKCVGDRIYGDNIIREKLPNMSDARSLGDPHRAEGISVLIRPAYNEVDDNGRYFREWRSFNGEPFREVRFAY